MLKDLPFEKLTKRDMLEQILLMTVENHAMISALIKSHCLLYAHITSSPPADCEKKIEAECLEREKIYLNSLGLF